MISRSIKDSIPFYCVPWPAKTKSREFEENRNLVILLAIILIMIKSTLLRQTHKNKEYLSKLQEISQFIHYNNKCRTLNYQTILPSGCKTSTRLRQNNIHQAWERSPPSQKWSSFGRSSNSWNRPTSWLVMHVSYRLRYVSVQGGSEANVVGCQQCGRWMF